MSISNSPPVPQDAVHPSAISQRSGIPINSEDEFEGLFAIFDGVLQVIRLTICLALWIALAGTLYFGLTQSARLFSQTSRSSRQAVHSVNSIGTLAQRLRTVASRSELKNPHNQFVRQLQKKIQQSGFSVTPDAPESDPR